MSEAIYKYPILDVGTSEVRLPVGAKVLDFQYQGDQLVMWAVVSTVPTQYVARHFRLLPTGQLYDFNNRKYQKTIQDGTGYVSHIFEILG